MIEATQTSSRARVFRLLRLAAATLIVTWLSYQAGIADILSHLRRVDIPLLCAALALMLMDSLVKAWNWRKLIASIITDRDVSFTRVMSWYFAGGFLGAVVPSSASTDAFRAFLSQRSLGGDGAACAASVLTLNGLGWFAGCLLGLIGVGLLALGHSLPAMLGPAAVLFVLMAVTLPIGYVMLSAKRERLLQLLRDRRWPRLKRGLKKFLDALFVFERAHVRFLEFLVIAASGLLAQAGMFALTAASVGVYLPFGVWMILAPLTRIVALVPISVADFGLIQGVHVFLLMLFDVPQSQAFVISTLFALQGLFIHATAGSAAFVYGGRVAYSRPNPTA